MGLEAQARSASTSVERAGTFAVAPQLAGRHVLVMGRNPARQHLRCACMRAAVSAVCVRAIAGLRVSGERRALESQDFAALRAIHAAPNMAAYESPTNSLFRFPTNEFVPRARQHVNRNRTRLPHRHSHYCRRCQTSCQTRHQTRRSRPRRCPRCPRRYQTRRSHPPRRRSPRGG